MRYRPSPAARIRADWSRSGLASTALGAIGFSLGIAVARVGVGETPASAAFANTPEFSVWCGITGFEVALWAICWMKARQIGRNIRSRLPRAPTWPFVIVVVVLIAAARVALFLYPTIHVPVYGMRVRQMVLQFLGILAAAPVLSGIWRIQAWLRSPTAVVPSPLLTSAHPGRTISDILFAREALQRLLLTVSLMIGAVVFATGALHSAFIASGSAVSGFPASGVLQYGALFTAALALLFVPAYVDLREFQRQVRDTLSRIPDNGMPSEPWYAERERLSALLQLDSGPLEAIRAATLLLSPFLSALVTLFVPDLKI